MPDYDKVDPDEIIRKLKRIICFLEKKKLNQNEEELRNTSQA